MLKFAFLINVPGQSPESFCGIYENEESFNRIVGTDNMDMAKEYMENLLKDGYTIFNLCGDFDDEITAQMQQMAGPDAKVRNASYLPEELAKVEALEEFTRYGIIVQMVGVKAPTEVTIHCEDFDTKAIFVSDQPEAVEAAKKLAAEGVHDIELCSWFDRAKTEEIIAAIDGSVPVGTCGPLE